MEKVNALKLHYPRTMKEIAKAFDSSSAPLHQPLRISQGLKIKDVPMIRRKRESKISLIDEEKENRGVKSHQENAKPNTTMSDRKILAATFGRASSKRLSLLQM